MVCPGEILAMLGPSGSRKTTLLTALGGRLNHQNNSKFMSGNINYNDQSFCGAIKRRTGFVAQDDVLYPHLTVTETLVFTAMLKLPNSLGRDEKLQHVEHVISELGLTRCRSSIVPKPAEYGGSDSTCATAVEGSPEMPAGNQNKAAPATQVNSQSFLQLTLYPITLKKGGDQCVIHVKVGDKKLVLANLSSDKMPQIPFDLVFDKEFELSHNLKSGSVRFCGYQTYIANESDEDQSDFYSELEENLPLNFTRNGNIIEAKPAPPKTNAVKPESSRKQKVKIEEPIKDEDDSDDSDEDDSDDDDESSDEDMLGADSTDEDGEDNEEVEDTPTPKKDSNEEAQVSLSLLKWLRRMCNRANRRSRRSST